MISVVNVSEAGQSHLKVRISCQSMDLAAELVQDLARYFQLDELESEADFPAELQAFEEVRAVQSRLIFVRFTFHVLFRFVLQNNYGM